MPPSWLEAQLTVWRFRVGSYSLLDTSVLNPSVLAGLIYGHSCMAWPAEARESNGKMYLTCRICSVHKLAGFPDPAEYSSSRVKIGFQLVSSKVRHYIQIPVLVLLSVL